MSMLTQRSTVYLDPTLHHALRLKAVETDQSVSELINQAVRQALAEDAEDIAAYRLRVKEPLIPFDRILKDLKRHGRL